jgi:hypothetical protein
MVPAIVVPAAAGAAACVGVAGCTALGAVDDVAWLPHAMLNAVIRNKPMGRACVFTISSFLV